MPAKRALLGGVIAILVAAAVLGLILGRPGRPKRFYRLEPTELVRDGGCFEVSQEQGRVYLVENGHKAHLEEVPTTLCGHFRLQGEKRVTISPKLLGKTGFYTYLYLQGQPKGQQIEFVLEVSRQGKIRPIRKFAAARISLPLFQDLDLRQGDRIDMRFTGSGIAYYSQPILYERYAAGRATERTNVIIVAADTLRGDQMGTGRPGQGPGLTPNLERFARDAVCLENAYAQTSWTLPSFMSLFTALNEYNHGVGIKTPLRPDQPSLVENLSGQFVTFGFHGGMKAVNGFARGFDFYQELLQTTPPYPQGGKALFDKALETLREGRFPRLFLFLHTYQLHSPYNPPEEFLRRLNPNPRSTNLQSVNSNQPAKTYLPVDAELRKSLKELYQAEVLAFDSYFGDFIARLRELKLYDNSLIIFMSDHGEEFFDHQGWAHSQSLYNELIQVPLLIKFPGGQYRGTRLSRPVGIVDIMPTILSYHGIAYDAGRLDGVDLLPLIRGREAGRRDPVVSSMSSGKYFASFPNRIALVSGRYKLIYNEPFTQQALEVFGQFAPPWQPAMFELYDVQADPRETNNIAARRPEIKARMLPQLLRILQDIRRKAAANIPQRLDKEMEKQLKALGYL